MQLALTPEVLFPLGACAVVAIAVIAVVVMFVRSRRAAGDDALVPTAADWTGEAATADPVPTPTVTVPALPQRLTVAEAIAVREADTAPLPVSSLAFLGARPATAVPVTTGPLPRVPQLGEPAPEDVEPAGPEPAADAAAVVGSGPAGSADVPEPAQEPAPAPEAVASAEAPEAGQPEPTTEPPTTEPPTAEVSTTEPPTAEPPRPASRVAAESTGSSPAVAHVLAARAAAGRETGVHAPVPSRTADARDRLLAVLLADPARAVGAAEELATCRGQLSDVLARLAQSGLSTDQLARLSGFSAEQVTTLLAQQGARQ